MHLQIVEAGECVTRRYVANGSHCLATDRSDRNRISDRNVGWLCRAWRNATPEYRIDGRSEGATAEKAVPFPCAVLDPKPFVRELRVREPRQGLVALVTFRSP
jgi:hypothetical protein